MAKSIKFLLEETTFKLKEEVAFFSTIEFKSRADLEFIDCLYISCQNLLETYIFELKMKDITGKESFIELKYSILEDLKRIRFAEQK